MSSVIHTVFVIVVAVFIIVPVVVAKVGSRVSTIVVADTGRYAAAPKWI
jgi:hypothetical protein